MVWRGVTTPRERLFSALVYLVPILETLAFGGTLFAVLPFLVWVFLPAFLLAPIYFFPIGGLAVVELAIFFALFILVVRNPRLPHFLRFNTLQALLLSILAALCRIVLQLLGLSQALINPLLGQQGALAASGPLLINVLVTAVFIFVVGASLYAIAQCLRGRYPDVPLVSEAAYGQVR